MKVLSISIPISLLLSASSSAQAQSDCPDYIIPSEACRIDTQDQLTCGFDYFYTGCSEAELSCQPTLSCKCNQFGDEAWACRADAMTEFCEGATAESTPDLRGRSCTIEEVDVELLQDGGGAQVEGASEAVLPSNINAVPISFYGLNYNTRKGPDWAADSARCKSRQEVVKDLTVLSRVTRKIRLLSLEDCDQGTLVWSVLNDELLDVNMQMWLGLWVGPDPQVFADELNALELILQDTSGGNSNSDGFDFSHLLGISVGSEAIYREDVTVDEAIENMENTKALLQEYGVTVPVAIVEIAPIYSNSQQLRLAADTIMTNTFPFWESTPIDQAVADMDADLSWLLNLPESQGKDFVLGEHGWPSDGYIEGVGIASADNQQQYMAESYCYLQEKGWSYYLFSGIDNDWRQVQDPNNTIEGNWGFLGADLTLKSHFVDYEFTCDDGVTYSFAQVDWSVPELAAVEIDTTNASCQLWQGCEALGGDCCPTPNGDYLGCCRDENFLDVSTSSENSSSTISSSGENNEKNITVTTTAAPSESVVVPIPAAPDMPITTTTTMVPSAALMTGTSAAPSAATVPVVPVVSVVPDVVPILATMAPSKTTTTTTTAFPTATPVSTTTAIPTATPVSTTSAPVAIDSTANDVTDDNTNSTDGTTNINGGSPWNENPNPPPSDSDANGLMKDSGSSTAGINGIILWIATYGIVSSIIFISV